MSTLRVAILQLCTTEDTAANLQQIGDLVTEAMADGAELICLPENATWLRTVTHDRHGGQPLELHAGVSGVAALARAANVPILLGSALIGDVDEARATNTSLLIASDGALKARYDKIHLFKVDLGPGTQFDESIRVRPGDRAVVVDLAGFRFGLTVCYDLRFAELYRSLARDGATVLCVPSAFTVPTGRAHWHALLRARAIENQAYVLAPAQFGEHGGWRASYGHSVAIDPWGEVIAELPEGVGYVIAELDTDRIATVRHALPSHAHHVLEPNC